ncbi:glycosyltransferase [Candidatus Microgenomates bacterium]|jgi:glycosyltransferase involved in cell wall biosynthesis|nr:MAG: glycosyltransferase [Candidatus Microgenomates bacterium]
MKTLTVIVPLYNEEKRLKKTLGYLVNYKSPKSIKIEKLIFVDDGSKDKTLSLLKNFQRQYSGNIIDQTEIFLISYPLNKGRGYAVMQGVKEVNTDFGMFLDGDMSIPLENLKEFSLFMHKGYEVLVGSKKLPQTISLVKRSMVREIIGTVHSKILQTVLGIKIADFTGGFKVFSYQVCRDVFPRLTQERWGLDPEVIYVSNKLNYRIVELPVTWKHISKSSKVNLVRDILRAFKEMFAIKVNDLKNIYQIRPQFRKVVVSSFKKVFEY